MAAEDDKCDMVGGTGSAIPARRTADDNQHMGFTKGTSKKIQEFVSKVDALEKRMDKFGNWNHQKKPEKVKPKTKNNMQPRNRHPKEID